MTMAAMVNPRSASSDTNRFDFEFVAVPVIATGQGYGGSLVMH
jgi:hypothetical protein